jgi:hypothetical protein
MPRLGFEPQCSSGRRWFMPYTEWQLWSAFKFFYITLVTGSGVLEKIIIAKLVKKLTHSTKSECSLLSSQELTIPSPSHCETCHNMLTLGRGVVNTLADLQPGGPLLAAYIWRSPSHPDAGICAIECCTWMQKQNNMMSNNIWVWVWAESYTHLGACLYSDVWQTRRTWIELQNRLELEHTSYHAIQNLLPSSLLSEK